MRSSSLRRPTYVCPLAATGGQVGGFLHTDVMPVLEGAAREVLYLGDLDHQGGQIEANTLAVLEREAGELAWRRIAITREQVAERKLEPITKPDRRYRPARHHEASETEALGQSTVIALVREALDALLPEPLEDVRVREQQQRDEWTQRLNGGE